MVNKYKYKFLKTFIFLIIIFVSFKTILLIPAHKAPVYFADKLILLQKMENNVIVFLNNVGDTYKIVVAQQQKNNEIISSQKELVAQYAIIRSLRSENKLLKNKLKFIKRSKYKLIPARIISRNVDNWFNFIIVNKGLRDGVKKNMPVINEHGVVGYAKEITPKATKVVLIIDPSVIISGINHQNKEIGVLTGNLAKPLKMSYIRAESSVTLNQEILTSGYSFIFPKGLSVGTINNIFSSKNNLYKEIQVKPAVDFTKLDIVFFIK
ncbi:rod shape-determining protein MreC [bacterium]|nr:rod shape-determining protein MreC [bacterium]